MVIHMLPVTFTVSLYPTSESVLIEMEQLRQETDDAGPQDELEYWKRRMAKFKFLAEQMEAPQVGHLSVFQITLFIHGGFTDDMEARR